MIDSYDRLIRVKSLSILSAVFITTILLFTTPAAADTQISFGQMISESINSPVEIDKYTFDAVAGDRILVKMTTVSPSLVDSQILLYAPDGSQLNNSYDQYGPGATQITSAPLPTSGTYTMLAQDAYSNDTGDYEIYIQRLNNPEITTPIGFGEVISGTIDFAVKPDTYTFDALEGDVVLVRMTTISPSLVDSQILLYAPDGSLLNNSYDQYGPGATQITSAPLPTSGTYTVLAQDAYSNDTGDYEIYIQRLNNPEITTPIGFGEVISGTIDFAVKPDTYTFDALEGDVVLVRMTTISPSLVDSQILLYAPDGSLLNNSYDQYGPGATQITSAPLPTSGTYTMLAQDAYSNDTGDYEIYIQRLNNPEITTPIGFGEVISGTIDFAVKPDTYTFDALEGDVVLVRMTTISPSLVDSQILLYAPDGSLLNNSYDQYGPGATQITSAPLPTSGTYTVLAQDAYSNETGDYAIQLMLIVGTEGSLTVRPVQALNSSGTEGGPFTPSNITYTLKNVGDQPIKWTLTKSQDWLGISKTGGTLAADSTDSVTVSIKAQADSLSADAYFNTLTFTNVTEPDQVIIRQTTLLVKTPEGSLVVTPDNSFSAAGPRHGPFAPSNMTYTLKNVGDALMNWKVAKTAHWLTLSAEQGSLNTGETVNVHVDINDAPDDFAWGIYKDRLSFINTTNGNGDTLRDVVLTIEAVPSAITCELSDSNPVLGEPLEVSGQITPQPNQSGAFVDIAMIGSDAGEIHRSVVANALGQFSYTVACDDMNQAGNWTVRTNWSGDESLYGATSADRSVEVTKADTRVTINSTSQALKIDVPVDISGKLTPQPDCGGDLSGTTIEIHISGPGNISKTESVTTNDRWGHYVLQDYEGFDALGDWTVQAVFAGGGGYESSNSDLLKVKVVETAGYAVVVQGKISSNEGLASHNKTANFVYNQLIARGLLDDDIMYFNYDDRQPGVDSAPTKSGIQDAVTQWAKSKMNAKPANLYLVLIDHGFDDIFYINPETITALEVKGWLDVLQAGLTGQAAVQEIISVLGFCRSGSFIDDLSGSYRVIIASAAADESSYKGPLDKDGIREGEYFVSEFFKAIAYGKSITQSFEEAGVLAENFTGSASGLSPNAPYYDDALQHPLLDDNGDGLGSNELSDPTGDGVISEELFIGVNTLTTNDPEDVSVTIETETIFMDESTTSTDVWARVDNNSRLDTLWIEIKPAGFSPVGQGGSEQIEMDLTKAVFDAYNSALDRYEWTGLSGFLSPGTYQVFYFAKDSQSANVSPLMLTTVYKAKSGNQPPAQFALVAPASGATELTSVVFDWEDTVDPEGDGLTYTLLISKGDDTFSNPIRKEGLLYSACLVTAEEGLEDLSAYYWKVRVIDEYGAFQDSEVRLFHTNNTNPVACWINGHVYDTSTGQPITGAAVEVGSSMLNTAAGGYYIGVMAPGNYNLMATATGYKPSSYPNVLLPDGDIISKDFGLVPIGSDSDGDSIPDAVENALSCLDPLDADTDNDGLADGTEDANQNSVIDSAETDPCDPDSDGDGVQDGTELGITAPVADPDGAGPLRGTNVSVFIPDSDPGSSTDPLDEDSDNDGRLDGEEDKNHNGRVDPGENDPNQPDLKGMPWIPLLLLDSN